MAGYLKETGDWSILDEMVPFDNDEAQAAPLFEHLTRSFEFTLANRGPHGLPLIGRADWNDCLNLNCFSTEPGESFQTTENQAGGVAESVFIAAMFAAIGPEYAEIAERRGLADVAARARAAVEDMRAAVLAHGWDGEWFLRAYDFYGQPVGTDAHDEGKIWIEPQGMAIMGGIGLTATDPADPAHASSVAVRALDSVVRAAGHRPRPGPAVPGVHQLPDRARRGLHLPAGLQGERRDLLPQQPVGDHRRDDGRPRRARLRLLPADHPGLPRGHLRDPPARALRVRPDDRRQAGAPPR